MSAFSAAADGSASKYIAVEIAPDGAPTCGGGCGEEAVTDGGGVHRIAQGAVAVSMGGGGRPGGGSRGGVVAVRVWHAFAGKTPSAIFRLKGESFRPLLELLPISG